MNDIEKRARELLARLQKAKRNEAGHWCDARSANDAACEILPQIIVALTPPEGYMLVEGKVFDSMREFVTGFHGMSRNNAENLAAELIEQLDAARPEVK